MIKRMIKNSNTQISAHIHSSELDCPCGDPQCRATFYSPDLLERFERMRLVWGEEIVINSGHRCVFQNKAVGGSDTSTHMIGHALDLRCPVNVSFDWFEWVCEDIFEFTYSYPESKTMHVCVFERD